MKRGTSRFGHGYRANLVKGGREGAVLHIQRNLTNSELALLDRDLQLLSGSFGQARWLQVYLEVPLSASLARALEELTQRYELLTTVSVPPIRHRDQQPLTEDMMEPSKEAWLHVVPRPGESP